jgi:hypothetical protein
MAKSTEQLPLSEVFINSFPVEQRKRVKQALYSKIKFQTSNGKVLEYFTCDFIDANIKLGAKVDVFVDDNGFQQRGMPNQVFEGELNENEDMPSICFDYAERVIRSNKRKAKR